MRVPQSTITHLAPKTEVITGEVPGTGGFPMVSVKEEFYNGLHIPITVVFRSGIRTQIPPSRGAGGNFVILQIQEFQRPVILDNTDLSSDCGAQTSMLSKQIIEALGIVRNPSPLNNSYMDQRVSLAHHVTHEDLRVSHGVVYVPSLDLVVSTLGAEATPPHPYSMRAMRQRLVSSDPVLTHINGLHYQIRIVDRSGVFGFRWINLNGRAFSIPVVTEGDYQDGVYVISTHPSDVDHNFNYARADYYQFEEVVEHVPLYRTRLEAETLGDPQSAMKRELDAERHRNLMEAERLRQERQTTDYEHNLRTRELEREREVAKHRLLEREERLKERESVLSSMEADFKIRDEQLKRDLLMTKHHQEKQSAERKAFLEMLKFGPAVIVASLAVYKTVQKIREKK